MSIGELSTGGIRVSLGGLEVLARDVEATGVWEPGERVEDSPLKLAAKLRRSGHIEQAIAAYESVLVAQPDSIDAMLYLGRIYRDAKDSKRAIQYFTQAQVHDPTNEVAIRNLGRLGLRINK